MKIALASMPVCTGDVAANLETMLQTIGTCRGEADLLLFGEAALQGFESLTWAYAKDQAMTLSRSDDRFRVLRQAARDTQLAVCLGYFERDQDKVFSSQMFLGADGTVIENFRRVSPGWKEPEVDTHYREDAALRLFSYGGVRFCIGLCGDLWTDPWPARMNRLSPDFVLWPVWCDYPSAEWNSKRKHDYARQAARCGRRVLLVNPYCLDREQDWAASGGSVYFEDGMIRAESAAGAPSLLILDF